MSKKTKRNIWKNYIFQFFTGLFFFDAILIPFFTEWGRISFFLIMVLQAWFMICIFLFEIPMGTIADYLGRKYSLMLACVVLIIAVIVYTSTPNFFIFMMGEALWALSAALVSGAGEAFIYDTLKEIDDEKRSKKVFGRTHSFWLLGMMVAGPIGSVVAFFFGLKAPVLLMIVPFGIGFGVALTFKEPKVAQNTEKQGFLLILKNGIKTLAKSKELKIFTIDTIASSTIAYFMIWLWQPMLMQAGVNIVFFGIVFSLLIGFEILVLNYFTLMERALRSKKRLLILSSVLPGSLFIIGGLSIFILLPIVPIILIVISIVVVGAFGLSRGVLYMNYMNKFIPSEERATVLSAINMFSTITLGIVNPIIGITVGFSLNLTLIFLGVLALAFSSISLLLVKEKYLID